MFIKHFFNERAGLQEGVANSHSLPCEIAKLLFHRVNLKLLQRRKRAKERVKTERLFHNNPLKTENSSPFYIFSQFRIFL